MHYLKLALQQAKQRQGFTAPNPAVGAVVVKDGEILAVGQHWAAGQPHAEVDALNGLGERAKGASLYVTLEPCCHYGRTPPCTELIIQSGIAKVFYGFADPNPKVAGGGALALQKAGIVVEHCPLPEIDDFYKSYAYWQQTQKPWVTAKIALSMDGKIAGPDGARVTLTGAECAEFTHQQRCLSDAILTTATTVIADDPLLNVRLNEAVLAKPLYILDRQLKLSPKAKIFSTGAPVTLFHASQVLPERVAAWANTEVMLCEVPTSPEGLDLTAVLEKIGAAGVHQLWVEAGGRLFIQIFKEKLLHRAFIYLAPITLGSEAKLAFPERFDIENCGADVRSFSLGHDIVWELLI